MPKISLVFRKSEPQYAYKHRAYEKTCVPSLWCAIVALSGLSSLPVVLRTLPFMSAKITCNVVYISVVRITGLQCLASPSARNAETMMSSGVKREHCGILVIVRATVI